MHQKQTDVRFFAGRLLLDERSVGFVAFDEELFSFFHFRLRLFVLSFFGELDGFHVRAFRHSYIRDDLKTNQFHIFHILPTFL